MKGAQKGRQMIKYAKMQPRSQKKKKIFTFTLHHCCCEGLCLCLCVCRYMLASLCMKDVVLHVLDFVHARELVEELRKCVCVLRGWTRCKCAAPQTCRHWHRGMSATQRHGDRCYRGNGAAAAWTFHTNKCALSSLLSFPSPLLCSVPWTCTALPETWGWNADPEGSSSVNTQLWLYCVGTYSAGCLIRELQVE